MRPQLVAVPVALILMLLAVTLGAMRLLTLQGIAPTPLIVLQSHHGELIIFGFLTPLILTERYLGAVTFRLSPSIHVMPFLAVLGALLKLFSWAVGMTILNTLGSAVLALAVVLYVYLLNVVARQSAQSLPFRFMALGAAVLLAGALLDINRSPVADPAFTLLLVSFPLLTIIGERVELSRFLSPVVFRRAQWSLGAVTLGSILLVLRILTINSGYLVVAWAVLLAVAVAPLIGPELTLVRLGQSGLYRYLGRHLTLAYIWLFIGVVILVLSRENYPLYGAGTHSLAIGFVFTMIMAHAPVIAPILLKRSVKEERLGYYPLALLTLSVLMRVAGYGLEAVGLPLPVLSGFSGMVALLAIVLFLIMLARTLRPAQSPA